MTHEKNFYLSELRKYLRMAAPAMLAPTMDEIQHHNADFSAVNAFIDNNFTPAIQDIVYNQTEDFLIAAAHTSLFGGIATWGVSKICSSKNLKSSIDKNFPHIATAVGLAFLGCGEVYQAMQHYSTPALAFQEVASDMLAYTAGIATFRYGPDIMQSFKQAKTSLFGPIQSEKKAPGNELDCWD